MNILFPQVYHDTKAPNPATPQEPEPWVIALKDTIKDKYKSRSTASSKSSMTLSDNASTRSTVSSATTLNISALEAPKKKKHWYSLGSKSSETLSEPKFVRNSDKQAALKAIHNEAVASYFSTR
ncbi:hypothetical protein N7488_000015 [Penicillium malachiteum]|nr:hypothetical protein N7488_000015 [Penicillium malachiteum]